ncbi:hypothetical protein WS58_26100 [Burkholderia pseudomultivorans]|uniref:DUF3142 domain-containing protein n=1 Tax=Burkholderia pseudomultivorans TaxID=1207504 RepID=UPI000755A7B3|nr:DUF3142 domain-containing protein [Burkholderia pseudomultivorans]KVC35266.1 hypothetical protein WS55_31860 [Burkholderia pseudomultivorans]KVC36668.1 hypothetical protein WS58_26100 [Burkholderia pseudomultivorans]KVC41592.1 hypothetical protein WS56_32375 [Burkholderia pseudomultivorans]KWF02898.1 hypothetical protein WT55_02580 [Burkholderia pseudomultivorans]KWI44229.1 hypothetical protein WT72_34195 [Burkholderia pseudomultivorans]
MKRLLGAALLLYAQLAPAGTVDPAQYDAFWLWAGVRPQAVVHGARTVYVLQGQIEASPQDDAQVRILAQGTALPPSPNARVWLVYRAHTLRWTPRITQIMLAQLARWRASGRTITGIQIDFDARTRHLQDYLTFLQQLRTTLPDDCRLSITGLLDWSSRIDTDQVNQLRGIVDEVVVQTYQGRSTIPDYAAYLPRVARLELPFRIGLVAGGEWDAPRYLAANPWFRGYVVFLLNR